MPSPFPGMDPFLEQEVIWHDFHERFLPAFAAFLAAQVLPHYIVLIVEHIYLHDQGPEAAAARPTRASAGRGQARSGAARSVARSAGRGCAAGIRCRARIIPGSAGPDESGGDRRSRAAESDEQATRRKPATLPGQTGRPPE